MSVDPSISVKTIVIMPSGEVCSRAGARSWGSSEATISASDGEVSSRLTIRLPMNEIFASDRFCRVPWVEVFAVFVVSHVVGDYMLQTEWQATHKRGGLSGTPEMRRALFSHIATYTIAFIPALVWLSSKIHFWAIAVAAGVAIPHLIQDDGTLLYRYALLVKKADIRTNLSLGAALDQSFHILALFVVALLAGR